MTKIYKVTDKIKVDVGGLVFHISPLTFDQKSEIQALAASGDFKKSLQSAKLAVKYAVKDVDGLEDVDGNPYKLERDDSGVSEDSLDSLLNLQQSESLQMACLGLLQGIPKQFINPFTNEKLEGVSIVKEGAGKKK